MVGEKKIVTYVKVMESRPPPAPARAWAMLSLSCCCCWCCARAATGAVDLAGEDILLRVEGMVLMYHMKD